MKKFYRIDENGNLQTGSGTRIPEGFTEFVENEDGTFSSEELTNALQAEKARQDATQYQRDRASEYSATGEQLDRLWHSIDQGLFGESAKTSDFYLINKDIKDKYPKPTIEEV